MNQCCGKCYAGDYPFEGVMEELSKEEAVEGWEDKFIELFPNTESGISDYGTFCAIRDFISQLLAKAREEGRVEEAIRCADHEKSAIQQGLRMALKALPNTGTLEDGVMFDDKTLLGDLDQVFGWNAAVGKSRANIEALIDKTSV